ncbi:MAG: DsbA family protein [Gemmatimonadetes bacterium]|nr:DsbA family protein [Gemmatimonadota bacterium]NNM03855.1 DsbA family protein [Gemmatimonadota bacterium]
MKILPFCLLLLPLVACGGEGDEVQAQTSGSDSVVGAILESAAQQPAAERPTSPPSTSPRLSEQEQVAEPPRISEMGYNLGSAEAPVKVLEFSDFGCGYCRRFHEETFPVIKEIYVDGGYLEWKFVPFVIGMFPNGLEASISSECAGEQDQFFPMQGRLFATQRGWRNSEDPYAFFGDLAEEEGLDLDRFKACIEGGWRDNKVRANIRLGQQAGARGTPYYIVDGRTLPGALPLEEFRRLLDGALIQRGVTPPGK